MKKALLFTVLLTTFLACSNDDDPEETITEEPAETTNTYILAQVTNGEGVYILNQAGEEVYNFELSENLGNDANLLDDGSLVAAVKSSNATITFGGFGGKMIKQNPDKSIAWEIDYTSENVTAHHDVESLSNGNIIFLVWEKVSLEEAEAAGFSGGFEIFPEAIVEMNPLTQEVVWEWHMMDHLIQDHDETKANFGVVADNPNKIDLNYNSGQTNGDLAHMNGLTLDEENDLIYITVNFYSEVWVIDHSTTIAEAATSSGGNYGLGGDLVYRFGNPAAYDNNSGTATLDRVHYPNLLTSGNLLVYANQIESGQSEVIEFDLPAQLKLTAGADNEPPIAWSFTDPELFSNIISGAVRMRNGNTLIAEGTEGTLWEVSPAGEVISQQKITDGSLWRALVFYSDDPAIEALGIE